MRWKSKDKALIFRGLSLLLNSGVHLFDGFLSLSRQVQDPELAQALERIARRLSAGHPLNQAMRAEDAFSKLELGLVKVGEHSGGLHRVLVSLADFSDRSYALKQKFISSMIYPAFVLTLCLALLVFAPVFVFADLLQLLRELNTALPLPTRLYLGFSDIILSPVSYIGLTICLALMFWAGKDTFKRPAYRLWLEEHILKLPGLGPALKNAAAAEVAQAIAISYEAGIPILQALSLGGEVGWSQLFSSRLRVAAADLKDGSTLSRCLGATDFFSRLSLTILSGGEEVGQIAQSLTSVEKTMREATEEALDAFQKLLEPFLLVFIGGIVGFIAIATLAPTLQVIQGL